jgi:hypothetical protein
LITVYLPITEYPPPLSILGIITLASFFPQNPQGKRLRGQNIENKGVAGRFLAGHILFAFAEFTAFAWAIME